MAIIKQIISDLNTPTDYKNDWYGWVIHHWAHTSLGVFVAKATADLCLVMNGEYPYKMTVTVVCLVVFFLYQFFIQRDRESDMLNDVFYFGSGVIMAFIGFTEVSPGSDHLDSNPVLFWSFAAIWILSFIPAIARRIGDKEGNTQ